MKFTAAAVALVASAASVVADQADSWGQSTTASVVEKPSAEKPTVALPASTDSWGQTTSSVEEKPSFTGTPAGKPVGTGGQGWGASAITKTSVSTEIVETFVTFCPEATVLSWGEGKSTSVSAGTVTITDCPCTIEHPVTTISWVNSTSSCTSSSTWATSVAPVVTSSKPIATQAAAPAATVVTAGAGKAALSGVAILAGVAAALL